MANKEFEMELLRHGLLYKDLDYDGTMKTKMIAPSSSHEIILFVDFLDGSPCNKYTFPSIKELRKNKEFILRLLHFDALKGSESTIIDFMLAKDDKLPFSVWEMLNCAPHTTRFYKDEKTTNLNEIHDKFKRGFNVPKNFCPSYLMDSLVDNNVIGEVGLSVTDGKVFIEVFHPTRNYPSTSSGENLEDLTIQELKEINKLMKKM